MDTENLLCLRRFWKPLINVKKRISATLVAKMSITSLGEVGEVVKFDGSRFAVAVVLEIAIRALI